MMRKLLLLAAACVALAACNQKEELNSSLTPGKHCTLTASINPGQSPSTKITPDLASIGTTLSFKWEAGDKVTISNASGSQEFTVKAGSISKDGKTADFEGIALGDMSDYTVTYGDPTASTIPYQEGTFKPIASGTGAEEEFTIDSYCPVLELTLTGAVNVSSINYDVFNSQTQTYELKTTLDISNGITLNSTEKTVYFPVTSPASQGYGRLEFRNSYGVIKTKTIPGSIEKGEYITFPTLDIRGHIELFCLNGDTETALTNDNSLSEAEQGTQIQLVARFFPENILATNITWSSTDESILTVDQNGLVTNIYGPVTELQNANCYIECTENGGSHTKASWNGASCFAAGTRITMADGSTKEVEGIVEGDLVRTFDHETGCISSAKVCLTYRGGNKAQSLDLTFASGRKLSIVGTHDLLLENTRKYVRINRGNVEQYVGKRFFNAESGKWDALVGYETGSEVDYYCIYSSKHLNCIAEGLLTCPDDVDFNLNIYELDSELKADAAQLSADIAKYGLFDITQYNSSYAQYKSQMEDLGCKYVYIAIGKGLIPESYLETAKSYWTEE